MTSPGDATDDELDTEPFVRACVVCGATDHERAEVFGAQVLACPHVKPNGAVMVSDRMLVGMRELRDATPIVSERQRRIHERFDLGGSD